VLNQSFVRKAHAGIHTYPPPPHLAALDPPLAFPPPIHSYSSIEKRPVREKQDQQQNPSLLHREIVKHQQQRQQQSQQQSERQRDKQQDKQDKDGQQDRQQLQRKRSTNGERINGTARGAKSAPNGSMRRHEKRYLFGCIENANLLLSEEFGLNLSDFPPLAKSSSKPSVSHPTPIPRHQEQRQHMNGWTGKGAASAPTTATHSESESDTI